MVIKIILITIICIIYLIIAYLSSISVRTQRDILNKYNYMGVRVQTWLDRFKSKENKLSKLKEQRIMAVKPLSDVSEDYENLMLGIAQVFPEKILLTGSSVLYMAGILDRKPHDLDFSLHKKLTQHEFDVLIDFFKLHNNTKDSNSRHIDIKDVNNDSMIICLLKIINYNISFEDVMTGYMQAGPTDYIKIDIFNHEFVAEKDIVEIFYPINGGTEHIILKAAHPSIAISYKARYAYDNRINRSSQEKHREDLRELEKVKKKYDEIITSDLTAPKKDKIVYSTTDDL